MADGLKCFVVRGVKADDSQDLAARAAIGSAIRTAITMRETGDYESVKVYQVRSGNVAFDADSETD